MVIANSFCLVSASGMGAAIAQRINGQYTFLCAAITLVVTLAMLRNYYQHKNSGWIVLLAVCLTLFHPIWTVNPIGGDMGYLQRNLSFISTAIVLSLMVVMFFMQWNRPPNNGMSSDTCQPKSDTE